MKKNRKLVLSAVAVMSLVAIAVTSITFSLAGNGRKNAAGSSDVALADEEIPGKTIIDYIVENSYKDDAKPYRVVEIGPVAASGTTPFETFVTGGSLKTDVFDAYNSLGTVFNPEGKHIEYKYFSTSQINSASKEVPSGKDSSPYEDNLAYISAADFIYISNDSNNTYVANNGNDIGEDLYDILHTYAVGKYNPLVIENPNASTSGTVVPDLPADTKFYTVVDTVFEKSGSSYKTFKWNSSLSADVFLGGALGSGSRYTAINGNNRSKNWTKLAVDGGEPLMADVLVISAAGNELFIDGTLSYKLMDDTVSGGVIPTVDTTAWDEPVTLAANQKVVEVFNEDNDIYTNFSELAYKSRYAKPNYVRFTEVSLDNYSTITDIDKYDMVVIENSCGPKVLTDAEGTVTAMTTLMSTNKHVIYDSSIAGKSGTSTDDNSGTSSSVSNDSNYKEIYYMVATTDAVARYSNVLVTDKAKFNLIITSNNSEVCKPIADIINKGAYRGIGGPGSSATTFTVLEIQPCYPVDKDVAKIEGDSYYTIPSEVVNGKTAEQIGYEKTYDSSGNLTSFTINGNTVTKDNDIEYYSWELSEANIAEALGMDANQIKVVHMSSEEFSTSKTATLGSYDMIYIGGNTSAKRSAGEYASLTIFTYGETIAQRLQNKLELLKGLPIYSMYSHNGDFVQMRGGSTFKASIMTAVTPYTGSSSNTFGMYNGNDITYDNLKHLEEYVDAGMPVVIGKSVNDAYQEIAKKLTDKGELTSDCYMQNSIDPDSNMFKFLKYCSDATKNGTAGTATSKVKGLKTSILWGFDQTPRALVDNNDGAYGDTATGYVSVFADGADRDNFVKVYKDAHTRAKLAITSMPTVYSLYDKKTRLDDRKLKFDFEVLGTDDYDVKFYIDYNLDSNFEAGEALPCTVGKGTLTCDLASDSNKDKYGAGYFGPVYWMLEVTDNNTGSKVSTTNICYIKKKNEEEKQKINVLQVIPVNVGSSNATGRQGNVNLLFCTKCQRALTRLEYNPYTDRGFDYLTYYDFHLFDSKSKNGCASMAGGSKPYLGLHEHQFGIVKYDSSLKYKGAPQAGMDDWDDNFADEVSDLYNFDVDIFTSRELEAISDQVREKAAEALALYPEFAGKTIDTLDEDELAAFKQVLLSAASEKMTPVNEAKEEVAKAKENLDKTLTAMITKAEGLGKTEVAGYFKRILAEEYYEDYYIYFQGKNELYVATTDPEWQYVEFTAAYEPYARAKDKEILAQKAYDEAFRIANFDNWIKECYQALIFGPAEDFNDDDINTENCLDDIENYIVSGGSTILFHSIISVYNKAEGSGCGPVKLSERIRGLVGMDKNHLEVDTSIVGSGNKPYYLPYKAETVYNIDGTVTKYPSNKYYYMNLSYKLTSDANTYFDWATDIGKATAMWNGDSGIQPNKYLTNVAYTNTVWAEVAGYGGANATPYVYSKYNHMSATTYARAEAELAKRGTDRAGQTNKGIITMYPYTLSEALNISATHAQAYALDIENDKTTVWYTFGGGSNNIGDFHKDQSSIYAASPKDGADSYFIYSFGSVFYCGAGHSEITGMGKDNNDERRLYLNVICNTVTNEGSNTLDLYDYQKETTGDKLINAKATEYDYTYKIDADPTATDIYPEFSFAISTAKGNSVSSIKLYYDYGDKGTSAITDYKVNTETGNYDAPGDLTNVGSSIKIDTSKLIDNKYAYLVVEVKTTKGGTIKKTIKVMLKSYLFDLT